jgi:hypothetical protein
MITKRNITNNLVAIKRFNTFLPIASLLKYARTLLEISNENSIIGLHFQFCEDSKDFVEILLNFKYQDYFQFIKEICYRDDKNRFALCARDKEYQVLIPFEGHEIKWAIARASDLEKKNQRYTAKLIALKKDETIVTLIDSIEDWIESSDLPTISTNEVQSISIVGNKYCYVTFYEELMRDHFKDWIAKYMRTHYIISKVDTQPRIIYRDVNQKRSLDEQKKVENKKTPPASPRKQPKKAIDRPMETEPDNCSTEAKRSKFTNERVDPDMDKQKEKKLPRKLKFLVKNSNVKRFFKMVGTGNYDINLEDNKQQRGNDGEPETEECEL